MRYNTTPEDHSLRKHHLRTRSLGSFSGRKIPENLGKSPPEAYLFGAVFVFLSRRRVHFAGKLHYQWVQAYKIAVGYLGMHYWCCVLSLLFLISLCGFFFAAPLGHYCFGKDIAPLLFVLGFCVTLCEYVMHFNRILYGIRLERTLKWFFFNRSFKYRRRPNILILSKISSQMHVLDELFR